MLKKQPTLPQGKHDLDSAKFAVRLHGSNDVLSPDVVENIKSHLGGDSVLADLGAYGFVVDHDGVSFKMSRSNPKGVRTVVISAQSRDLFKMDCYGKLVPGTLRASLIGTATQIVPENLATVLGKLAGVEELHHRHY